MNDVIPIRIWYRYIFFQAIKMLAHNDRLNLSNENVSIAWDMPSARHMNPSIKWLTR